jgi:arylsulfatase A-like enzyme
MPRPPNILWIVTTQWRAQACGYAGDPNAHTPAIDALARTSVNYSQAVTPHPFGPFARAALLTGTPSPENGVVDYYDPLPRDARTIAHDLNERGYATGFFGKWHLAERDRSAPLVGEAHAKMIVPPDARGGFSFWEGFEGGFQLADPWLHGTRLSEPTQFPGYQSDIVCERAAGWTREQTAPWFAIVSLEPPHPPYDIPLWAGGGRPRSTVNLTVLPNRGQIDRATQQSQGDPASAGPPTLDPIAQADPTALRLRSNVPLGGEVEQKARAELAGYYAHIEATDRAIGKLIASHTADECVVVFTSVHGDMHGSHGLFRKGWPHEEAIRVPLLVRHPELETAQNDTAISLLDLRKLTTESVDRRIPEFARSNALISMPSVVPLPHQCDRIWRGVRTKQRKLILNADGSPWMFFDLENDPLEMKNLVSEPAFAAEMETVGRALCPPWQA